MAMFARIRRLLAAPVFPDDEETTRRANLLNVILLLILALVIPYTIISQLVLPSLAGFLSEVALILLALVLLFLLHRGHIRFASLLLSSLLWVVISLGSYYAGGIRGTGTSSYFGLVLIAGLLLGGRMGIVFAGLSITAGFVMFYAETQGMLPPHPEITPEYALEEFGTVIIGVAALLYLATRSINNAFAHARNERHAQIEANRELQEIRASLEQRVAERTQELSRRTEELAEMVDTQEQLLDMIRQMSVPVVPVMEGIIVLPLVGTIDSQRASQVVQALLDGIKAHQARMALVDITGVPVVDTQVAQLLLEATDAARLLGTQVVLVGIRPEVAQTIVGLGIDLAGIVTRADLQAGVEHALRATGRAGRQPTKASPVPG